MINIIYTVQLGKMRSRTGSGICILTHPDTKLKWGHTCVTFTINSSSKMQKRQWSHWRFHNCSPKLSATFLNWKECCALLTCSPVRHEDITEIGIWEGTKHVWMLNPQRGWAHELLRKELIAVCCDLSSPSMLASKPFVALRNWWYLSVKLL